ncbi:perlucin-like protein [Lingula anatina]|uniref:Perlucin-like protein n=1 Tax=Lingula anatina TaxID=7574 RepID=A0A1S3JNV8_LINAN|nr:perlucin-like protein [Lingula anatina]|eukprot:XP_013412037.1 perlucin-like protein [Lingula anatina]
MDYWLCRSASLNCLIMSLLLCTVQRHICQPTTEAETGRSLGTCFGPDCIRYTVAGAGPQCQGVQTGESVLRDIQEQLRCLKQDCPHSFVRFNCSCYKVVNRSATWRDAQWDCGLMGAYLMDITSQQEQVFIGRQAAAMYYDAGGYAYGFWIGGYEKLPAQNSSSPNADSQNVTTTAPPIGEWKWNNSGKPFTFTNWNTDEPNNWNGSSEDCLMMLSSKGYKWNDAMCNEKHKFICELEL